MAAPRKTHGQVVLAHWKSFPSKICSGSSVVSIHSLDLAAIVAVARWVECFQLHGLGADLRCRHGTSICTDKNAIRLLVQGAQAVQQSLDNGGTIYGQ